MPLSRLKVLPEEYLSRVHEASLKILWETGVVFESDEAVQVFKAHGAKVDGHLVRIPAAIVEESLAMCPKRFRWWGVDESHSVILGGNQDRTAISPNMGPVYIQDLDRGRRRGTLEDFANLIKLCEDSDVVNVVGAIPVEPGDVAVRDRHLMMTYMLLKHTVKPLIGIIRTQEEEHQVFDMLEIAIGRKDYLLDHPVIGVSVNPLSPLRFGTEPIDAMLAYARRRQPVFILPCILAGATGPVSLLGTAVLQNTEMLAGAVFLQMINPGTPVVLSPASSVTNMRKATYITGSPEGHLINIAGLQMVLDFYSLPSRTMAGLTDSKIVDCQAGYETMQNIMLSMLSGVHLVNEALGVLDSIMTTSYEKFVIDEELLSRVLRMMKGIEVSEEALAVDVIQQVSHGGNYLVHPSTFSRFRDFWRPGVSHWDSHDDWVQEGAEDVVIRANRQFKTRLASAPESVIPLEVDTEIKRYLKSVLHDTSID
jgi:trimethylamine--corrinoid protein Co-methyltransferase